MNYSVGDFVIQLKNAAMARKREVQVPYSTSLAAISKVLIKEGFVETVSEEKDGVKRTLVVKLRYQRRKPSITDVRLISKTFTACISSCKRNWCITRQISNIILSTNVGILTGKDAIKKGVGGELIFKIW